MKQKHRIFNVLLVFIGWILLSTSVIAQSQYDGFIIGSDTELDRIYIMDPNGTNMNNNVVWSLSPEELTGVASGEITQVGGNEVKRVMGGTHILFISNRIVLLRIADKRVIWYGRNGGGNPHSVELLPDGNVVTANSEGTSLKFFDTSLPNNSLPVNEYHFRGAHGVVWDAKREVLWATGSDQLHAFYYNDDKHNPNVSGIFQENFIEKNGHDLYPVPGEDKLYFTAKDTWVFDIETRVATKIDNAAPKSISQNVKGGEIIYTVGEGKGNEYGIGKSYTPNIRSLNGPTRTFTGAGFYKVRWLVPCPFSYPEYDNSNSGNNLNPVASISLSKTDNVMTGDNIQITFGGTDANGTIASLEIYRNGVLRNWNTPHNWTAMVGIHTFEVVVTDNDGGKDTASITIEVNDINTLPVASITANPNTNITEGGIIELVYGGTDSDGTIVSVEFYRNGNLRNRTSPHSWTAVKGENTFEVVVTDNNGGKDTASVTINVEAVNINPIGVITVSPLSNLAAGDLVTIDYTSSDADGSIVSTELLLNGVSQNWSNGATWTTTSGSHTIELIVIDNDGGQDVQSVTFNVDAPNENPYAFIYISPNVDITEGDEVEIIFGGTDQDGTIEQTIIIHNNVVQNWTSSDTWVAKPGAHKFEVTVIDNEGAEHTVVELIQVANNLPPQVYLSATPDTDIMVGDEILINFSANDSDGYIESLEILLDGVEQNWQDGDTWTASSGYHTIELIATDNFGLVTTETIILEVEEISTGTFDLEFEEEVRVYPNPMANYMNIALNGTGELVEVSIFTSNGNILFSEKYLEKDITLNLQELEISETIIFVEIKKGDSIVIKKVFVKS